LQHKIPFPVVISKDGKWFVASSPVLDIATQGRTEKEVKENIAELIDEYLKDPDTPKPTMEQLLSVSLTNIPVIIPEGVLHRKTSTIATAQSN
jgi:predicted RNase H-like HicB family nuclease